jgi:hypothetical protein
MNTIFGDIENDMDDIVGKVFNVSALISVNFSTPFSIAELISSIEEEYFHACLWMFGSAAAARIGKMIALGLHRIAFMSREGFEIALVNVTFAELVVFFGFDWDFGNWRLFFRFYDGNNDGIIAVDDSFTF